MAEPGDDSLEPAVALLSKQGVRRLMSGHPWIRSDHVVEVTADDGDLVLLEGPPGVPRGQAVFASTRLALRVVSRDPGAPLDDDFWVARLDAAVAARDRLAPGAEACRWVHAEADGLPGLVVDRYGPVAVLQAGCAWADGVAPAVARRLVERHGMAGVLARHDGGFREPEGLERGVHVLAGEVPDALVVDVAGIPRRIDPRGGQKTGSYLDQRENQQLAARELPVGRALDAFGHDGGFGLQLARAGSQVEIVDSSAAALERAREVAAQLDLAERVTTTRANVFEDLRARAGAGETFDGIVLDPPALAKRRHELRKAERAYKELNLRALRLLRPGGRLMTCSCSFHMGREAFLDVIAAAAADARVDVRVLARTGAAACHPVRLGFPESDYLKAVLLEVL